MAALDYISVLKELLRPLGIYDVDNGLGAAELHSVGTALNLSYHALLSAEAESNPLTAGETGLTAWEKLLPFVPAYRTAADRRRAIAALLRIDGTSFTLAGVNDAITGCGIRAVVAETETPQTVSVSFPWNRGEPDDFDALRERIEMILPCHLAIEYVFIFVIWSEMETLFPQWSGTEENAYSWRELERLGGEE